MAIVILNFKLYICTTILFFI